MNGLSMCSPSGYELVLCFAASQGWWINYPSFKLKSHHWKNVASESPEQVVKKRGSFWVSWNNGVQSMDLTNRPCKPFAALPSCSKPSRWTLLQSGNGRAERAHLPHLLHLPHLPHLPNLPHLPQLPGPAVPARQRCPRPTRSTGELLVLEERKLPADTSLTSVFSLASRQELSQGNSTVYIIQEIRLACRWGCYRA